MFEEDSKTATFCSRTFLFSGTVGVCRCNALDMYFALSARTSRQRLPSSIQFSFDLEVQLSKLLSIWFHTQGYLSTANVLDSGA